MKTKTKIKKSISKTIKKVVGIKKKEIPRNNFSRKTKAAIREFQHGYCATNGCNVKKLLELDHIRGRDDSSAENCQLLCPFHHREKSNKDRIRKQIAKRLDNE